MQLKVKCAGSESLDHGKFFLSGKSCIKWPLTAAHVDPGGLGFSGWINGIYSGT